MRACWIGLGLLAASCAGTLPPLPGQGGPAWFESRSAHFVVWSDAEPARVHDLVQQMEHFRSIIYGVAFPELPPGGTTFVVVFRDFGEARTFLPTSAEAEAFPGEESPLGLPIAIMALDPHGSGEIAAHELTHAISFNAIHHEPHWFAEGLATYFGTLRLDSRQSTVQVGALPTDPHQNFLGVLAHRGLLKTSELFRCWSRCRENQADRERYYATAWALYAYLRNEHPTELVALERAFDEGEPARAWQRVFPQLSPDQLDAALESWIESGHYKIWSYTISLQTWPTEQTTLRDADVYALRAMLFVLQHGVSDAARDARAAITLDPTNVLARTVEVLVTRRPLSGPVARALVAAHPQSWSAWALLAAALRGDPEAASAHAKACALAAENPSVFRPSSCASSSDSAR